LGREVQVRERRMWSPCVAGVLLLALYFLLVLVKGEESGRRAE
jgi:hypothetical protein